MTKHQTASICFIVACLILCGVNNSLGSYLCLSVSLVLFGFLLWLDRNKVDRVEELENKFKSLKEKVDLQSLKR